MKTKLHKVWCEFAPGCAAKAIQIEYIWHGLVIARKTVYENFTGDIRACWLIPKSEISR